MTDKDWRKFCELMTTAAEYYRVQPWTERAMKRAFELLKDLSIEQVGWAMNKHMSGIDGNCSRFCPNAADLRLALTGTPEQQSVVAWNVVRDALEQVKSGRSVRFDHPAYHFALKACGGWTGLCMSDLDMEARFRRAFITAVERLVSWRDVPDHLPGSDELRGYASWSPEQIAEVRSPLFARELLQLSAGE